jgi:predicted DNA-binding protein YlxM (UPF0122 family)
MEIDKVLELNELYDQYGSLLTEKQKNYFILYYEEDLSLSEIAEQLDVSRNAIHKQLKAIEKSLYRYEENLGKLKMINKIYDLMDEVDEDMKQKLERLIEE